MMPPPRAENAAVRQRLARFYRKYNPSKLQELDVILQSFAGDEAYLFEKLTQRYGEEPPPSPTAADDQPSTSSPKAVSGTTSTITTAAVALAVANRAASGRFSAAPVAVTADVPLRGPSPTPPVQGSAQVSDSGETATRSLKAAYDRLLLLAARVAQLTVPSPASDSSALRDGSATVSVTSLELVRSVMDLKSLTASLLEAAAAVVQCHSAYASPKGDDAPPSPLAKTTAVGDIVQQQPATTTPAAAGGVVGGQSMALLPPNGRKPCISVALEAAASAARSAAAAAAGSPTTPTTTFTLVLHPGVYFENLQVPAGASVEIKTAFVGAQVEIVPYDAEVPVMTLGRESRVRIAGVQLRRFPGAAGGRRDTVTDATSTGAEGDSQDNVPAASFGCEADAFLLVCSPMSEATLQNCTLHGGGAAAIGHRATVRCQDCVFSGCPFAAVYLKSGAFGALADTRVVDSVAAGVRCRDASFSLSKCQFVRSGSDAVVCHGAVEATMEDCLFTIGEENGILLSPASCVVLERCVITDHRRFAVYAPSGAHYATTRCTLLPNGLGDYNRRPASSTNHTADLVRSQLHAQAAT